MRISIEGPVPHMTRYFNNQEGTSDNEKQKIYLRTKDLHFRGNEIYCMKVFN